MANVEDQLMREKLNRLLRKDMILYNFKQNEPTKKSSTYI
jgi:hypothetical protein